MCQTDVELNFDYFWVAKVSKNLYGFQMIWNFGCGVSVV